MKQAYSSKTFSEILSMKSFFREYWQDEELTYHCANGELGLEASNNVTVKYSCIWGYPVGNYTTPKSEHDWPICMERTTTIKTRKFRKLIYPSSTINNT